MGQDMKLVSHLRSSVCLSLQLVLVLAAFCFDFAHGIALKQHDTGFQPMFRVRQTLAVAISRMREPPLHGYLAYQSVIDGLNRNGFAFFSEDVGPHLARQGSIE